MIQTISEPDWRLFRQLRPVALERFYQRTLAEIGELTQDGTKSVQERYLAIYDLMRQREREWANAFDNPRRSTAIAQLVHMKALHLLSEDEMTSFSATTREIVHYLADR